MRMKAYGRPLALLAATLVSVSWPALAADYKEAPQLAERVAKGELPPVAQRLPATPLVLQPLESVGSYGGVWRSALKGTLDNAWLQRTVLYDPLLAYNLAWTEVQPNLAQSVSVNADATEFTFKLRPGHKWSDGQPFTAHDIVFAIQNVMKNPGYHGERSSLDFIGMTASAADDNTLVIKLAEPNSLFLQKIASVSSMPLTRFPKHYCGKYHPDFNTDVDALAKQEGFKGWSDALEKHCAVVAHTDTKLPTLNAWQLATPYDGINSNVRFVRNPYYFKVDPQGQQLPYLDGLSMTQTNSVDDIVLKGLNGEIDYSNRHLATLPNKAVFYDNQKKGDYRLIETIEAKMNTVMIQLNLTHKDPLRRKLFNEVAFRQALSLAIDRQEVIDVVFAGQGEPWQSSPRPESPWFHAKLAKQYTEFDPAKANAMLDALGLKRGPDGVRLDAQGRPLRITLYSISDFTEFKDVAELVAVYWRAVGIELDVRNVERSFVYETFRANNHDIHFWSGDGGLGDALLDPRFYFPFNNESAFAIPWAQWFVNPAAAGAEEPSAPAKRQMELYRELNRTPDEKARDGIFKQLLDISAEQFWVIGVSLPPNGYGIAKNDMRNIPSKQPAAWVYPTPGPLGLAQIYKAKR